ncbi:uncharacterized protein LOC136086372 [Hydra vulgaris]|uniref:Uncharacterized protein LOC136086372 n=1 Tax=Hydra vulgaris TaxID=6087 RepID=A0ABM4CS72_HYDVU
MDINIIKFNPLKAKSYFLLDKNLENKSAIINIKNEEEKQCFKWCIARGLNKKDNHPERVDKELKNQAEKINWDKLEFLVSLNQLIQFENSNQDISVNVYGYENSKVHILHVSKNNNLKHLIDLLLISNGETNHYCLIKNLSKLLSSQTSNKHCKKYYCRNCLLGFNSEERLSNHKSYCETHDSVRIELPQPNSTMQFTNHNKSIRVPFVVYADFESFIKLFCYYIKCFDKSFYKRSPITYTSTNETDDAAQKFVDSFHEDIIKICDMIKFPKKMIFTPEKKHNFKSATECHICREKLGKDKVRDHCHITGKYGGAAHQNRNLNYKIPKFFPLLFHNLSGYDSQLFIKILSGGKLSCISNNEEVYISFSRETKVDEYIKVGKKFEVKHELRFLDSYRFMPSSLDALSKNLAKDQCKNIGKLYSMKKLDLLLRKGKHPYDWVDSINRFNETQLPLKESFF